MNALFLLYLFKCDVCVLNYKWINPKRFLIILYVFESDFYHSLCSCLMLTFFSLFKHVLCWKTGAEVFCDSLASREIFRNSPVMKPQLRVHLEAFMTHLRLAKIFATEFLDSPSRETNRNSFLKSFSWETSFKPLSSSLKPLFQYFYIKTQSIWMIFHSIKISKVILNYFHWFRSLDYVLESFVLLVGIFIIGVGKTYFFVKFLYVIGFFFWFALDVGPLWQKEHILRVNFMMFMHCFTLLFIVCTLGVW